MLVSCILLSTAKRPEWLDATIKSIDELDFKFNEKLLSVDEFDGYHLTSDIIEKYRGSGWVVDVVSLKSKEKCIKRLTDMTSSDYVFYAEDDVLINNIPSNVCDILNTVVDGRECGMLSMNLGGSLLDYPNHMGDLPYWLDNIIYSDNNIVSFRRLESQKSRWFFEFPSVFIKTNLLKKLISIGGLTNNNIEEGLTSRWFSNGLGNSEVSYWIELLEKSKLYKILDPNQGGANINLNIINNVQ